MQRRCRAGPMTEQRTNVRIVDAHGPRQMPDDGGTLRGQEQRQHVCRHAGGSGSEHRRDRHSAVSVQMPAQVKGASFGKG